MIAGLAVATWPSALGAQARVELVARPPSTDAERIGVRAAELVRQAGALPELSYGEAQAGVLREPPLARVTFDIRRSNERLIIVIDAGSDELTRVIALPAGVLDETAVEEAAQIAASSVSALLAGSPLPQPSDPEPESETANDEPPSKAAPLTPAPVAARSPAEPVVVPASAAPVAPAPIALPETASPPAHRAPTDEDVDEAPEPRSQATFAASLGYAVELFGEAIWLHGPQFAVAYARPFPFGAIGARVDVWLATTQRLQAPLIDAEASSEALRLFAIYDPWPEALFGLELGAGVGARSTTLEGVGASDGTAPAESSRTTFAAELYGGARLRAGLLLATLGFVFELDPVAVDYGLQYSDRFATTHSSSHVRPSARLHVGLAF